MASPADAADLLDSDVIDCSGHRCARVSDVLVDRESRAPQWLVVRMGCWRRLHHAVPLGMVERTGERLGLSVTAELVRRSPTLSPRQTLTAADELELQRYWARVRDT